MALEAGPVSIVEAVVAEIMPLLEMLLLLLLLAIVDDEVEPIVVAAEAVVVIGPALLVTIDCLA